MASFFFEKEVGGIDDASSTREEDPVVRDIIDRHSRHSDDHHQHDPHHRPKSPTPHNKPKVLWKKAFAQIRTIENPLPGLDEGTTEGETGAGGHKRKHHGGGKRDGKTLHPHEDGEFSGEHDAGTAGKSHHKKGGKAGRKTERESGEFSGEHDAGNVGGKSQHKKGGKAGRKTERESKGSLKSGASSDSGGHNPLKKSPKGMWKKAFAAFRRLSYGSRKNSLESELDASRRNTPRKNDGTKGGETSSNRSSGSSSAGSWGKVLFWKKQKGKEGGGGGGHSKRADAFCQDASAKRRSTMIETGGKPVDIQGSHVIIEGAGNVPPEHLRAAMFGMGCFYDADKQFWPIKGVYSTQLGYVKGASLYADKPESKKKSSEKKSDSHSAKLIGHIEVVRVTYDAQRIKYEDILKVFWQHNDVYRPGGSYDTIYRSVIFTHSPEQRLLAEESRYSMGPKFRPTDDGIAAIRTYIAEAPEFHSADDYKQVRVD